MPALGRQFRATLLGEQGGIRRARSDPLFASGIASRTTVRPEAGRRNEAIATVDRVCGRSKHDRKILMFAEGEEFTGPPGAAPTTEITRGTSNPATRRRLCDNPAVDNPLSGGLSP